MGEKMNGEIKQGQWMEIAANMMKNYNGLIVPVRAMEPFIQLSKMEQQQCLKMTRVWFQCLWKMVEAGRSWDVKRIWETCAESNKELLSACQESMKEQTAAHYEIWRTVVPEKRNPARAE